MSTALLKTAAIAAIGVVGLATTANAQSSRYGGHAGSVNGHTIASYEGVGTDCAPSACAAPVAASRYGSVQTVAPAYNPAPVIVDCSVFGNPGCAPQHVQSVVSQPTTVYTQPVQQPVQHVQSAPRVEIYEDSFSSAPPANCPSGTTAQADGTCLQGSTFSSSTSYSSGTTYSAPVTSAPANCPSGTVAQSDGTCMQSSTPTYTAPATTYTAPAPMVDATPSYGYGTDGSFGAEAYRPIRK